MKKVFKIISVVTLIVFMFFSFLYFMKNELFTNNTLYCISCFFFVVSCTTIIIAINNYPIVGGALIISDSDEEPYRFEFNNLLSELENEKSFIIEIGKEK